MQRKETNRLKFADDMVANETLTAQRMLRKLEDGVEGYGIKTNIRKRN